jgi:NAD(P)H dehydrogenase (quinone)
MTLAISGASGNLGRLTAESLLDQVDPSQVVLLTRSPEKLADLAARGADVRQADFDDAAGLEEALAGVDKLLLISTDTVGTRIAQQKGAIDAAKAAGVAHVIYTSAPKASAENPAIVAEEHFATEENLRASGLAWTFLRNNLYSEFEIPTATHAAASGQLFTNQGDGATAFVTREDCARAAAGALAGDGHENTVYEISGPEAITRERFAEIITEVTGRPVAVVQVDDEGFSAGLAQAGLPDFIIPVLASFGVAAREGYLDEVTTAVRDLTGQDPTPLAAVLTAAKDALLVPAAH